MPVVRKPQSELGGVGCTDFKNIFIASELNNKEYTVMQKHEEAHVWLWHNKRAEQLKNKLGQYNHRLWNIATDVEIAKCIYNKTDEACIKAPRSRLKGGILADSFQDLPKDIIYAEDVYEWVLENSPPEPQDSWGCTSEDDNDIGEAEVEQAMVEQAVEDLKEFQEQREAQTQAEESLKSKLYSITNKKPSLVEEVNATLRVRHKRPESYARQGRRELSGLIAKGRKSIALPPLVEVFVDRSGSFCESKTAYANEAVTKVLTKYRASIRYDTFYFGNDELRDTDTGGGGNTPYHLIMEHLCKTTPKIAIIITDDDYCQQPDFALPKQTKILCIPVGCENTIFSTKAGGKDVTI